MLEFVDSDLYFVQDKNNFINPLLQVGSGSGGPKITGSDRVRIRILIPDLDNKSLKGIKNFHRTKTKAKYYNVHLLQLVGVQA